LKPTPKPFQAVAVPAPPKTADSPPQAGVPPVPASEGAPATEEKPPATESSSLATPIPEADNSVEDVDEGDLEPEPTAVFDSSMILAKSGSDAPASGAPASGGESPQLERLLGSTDPFGEADTTHTSIDVRLPMAAAKAIEERAKAAAQVGLPPPTPPPPRASKPPPLPSSDPGEPLTSPGRRLDEALASRKGTSERALAMTDQNSAVDLSETQTDGNRQLGDLGKSREIPPDIVSATELALDDDEPGDVLVVDEFVEDSDEYEDVVEPSKPPGPVPG
jgi:hypothetical protein